MFGRFILRGDPFTGGNEFNGQSWKGPCHGNGKRERANIGNIAAVFTGLRLGLSAVINSGDPSGERDERKDVRKCIKPNLINR